MDSSSTFTPSRRIIGAGALASLPDVVHECLPGSRYLMLHDDATYAACGAKVAEILAPQAMVTPFSLGKKVSASLATAERIIPEAMQADGLIAVGTGTINDLAKYAASKANKPYICVATAASMNGFTSANASLEHHEFRHSYLCQVPRAVVGDLEIIAAAPKRLSRAGIGDTLCRTSVESDAILSHILLGTPYHREAFDLFRRHEAKLIAEAAKYKTGDRSYFELLMTALLDAGDWMARTGSSAIASQSEHMLIHTVELMYGAELQDFLHGELVALGTLTTAYLQQKVLTMSCPTLKHVAADESLFMKRFSKKTGPDLFALYSKKGLTPEKVAVLNTTLTSKWAEIKAAISAVQQPVGVLERLYLQLNLPTTAPDVRLDVDRYKAALNNAHLTRDRFTFLDLLALGTRKA